VSPPVNKFPRDERGLQYPVPLMEGMNMTQIGHSSSVVPRVQLLPGGVQVRVVEMTPDWARLLLAGNIDNRSMRVKQVQAFTRDMQAGVFFFNGSSIVIDEDGRLIDGQHRLQACADSGSTFVTILVTGVPSFTRTTIDAGAKKTQADQLRYRGEASANDLAATIRLSILWSAGRQHLSPTNSEIIDFLERHPEARDAVKIAGTIKHGIARAPRSPVAAVALNLLHAGTPHQRVKEFVSEVVSGSRGPGSATFGLFQTFVKWNQQPGRRSQWQHIGVTVKCWNATVLGHTPKIYRMRDGESFPALLDQDGNEVALAR
jgi:hypothetical protein